MICPKCNKLCGSIEDPAYRYRNSDDPTIGQLMCRECAGKENHQEYKKMITLEQLGNFGVTK